MELSIFPLPAVAEILEKHYIEVRLHTDNAERLEPKVYAQNKKLQKEMTNSEANPYFVLYDPKTGKIVKKRAGMIFEKDFVDFLKAGLE